MQPFLQETCWAAAYPHDSALLPFPVVTALSCGSCMKVIQPDAQACTESMASPHIALQNEMPLQCSISFEKDWTPCYNTA